MNIEPSESKVSKCQDPSNLVAPLPKVLIGKAKTPNWEGAVKTVSHGHITTIDHY